MEYLRLEIYKEKCVFWFIVLVVKSKIRQPHLMRTMCCLVTWQKTEEEKHMGEQERNSSDSQPILQERQ